MSGFRFFARRLVQGLVILWMVTTATFVLMHLAPGGPSMLADPKLGPVERAAIEERLGINLPLPAQYFAWHRNLLRGDLGQSYLYQAPAGRTVLARVPNTLLLAGSALVLGILIAVPFGIRAGLTPGGATDRVLEFASFAALSLPTFWYGIVLIMVFAAVGHLLPAGGMATPGLEASVVDRIRHLILPVAVLSLPIMAELFRYVRSGIVTGADAPHIPAARAKGLTEGEITRKHLLRNALLPLVTVVGLQAPMLIGGAAITETVFSWPGMGRLGVEAALGRDYPVIMATTLAAAVAVVGVNIMLDLLYRWIDPRVRIE